MGGGGGGMDVPQQTLSTLFLVVTLDRFSSMNDGKACEPPRTKMTQDCERLGTEAAGAGGERRGGHTHTTQKHLPHLSPSRSLAQQSVRPTRQ